MLAYRRFVTSAFIATLLSSTLVHAQGTWSTESSDGFTARAGLATAVVDGKIYAIGGSDAATPGGFSTLEVLDPLTNSWSTPTTTGTFTPRAVAAAVAVDQKIYVFGGYGTGVMNTLEVFDTRTNEWTTPVTTGTFTARSGLAALLLDGKIYALGGLGGTVSISTLEVFDPVNNTWSTPVTTGTFTARYGFAAAIIDGKIYAFGGIDDRSTRVNTLEVFDPLTNEFSTPVTTGTSTARSGVSGVAVDGKLYAIGNARDGSIVEVYDPLTSSWSTPVTGGEPTRRVYAQASMVGDKIYVMGGKTLSNQSLNTNESLSLETSGVNGTIDSRLTVELYPNPTRGIVTVRGTSVTSRVVVSNALGERVTGSAGSRTGDVSFDLSNLTAGKYFVSIASAGGVTTRMIVRE